jgi:hypothetical protein
MSARQFATTSAINSPPFRTGWPPSRPHRRIDQELDTRKQHDVRLTRIERHLELPKAA